MSDENDKPEEGETPEPAPDAPAEPTPDDAPADPAHPDGLKASDDLSALPVAPAPGPAAAAEAAPVDKARAARKPNARQRKKTADAVAHKAAVDATPHPEPSKEEQEDEKRKAGLQDQLAECQAEMDDAEAAIVAAKDRTKEILNQLYPSLGASDRHVDAVRGYIASEKKQRANRALAPARLKAMLEAAGKSPIDNAFAAQRARGMKRPVRSPATAAAGAGDQGGDAASQE